ncbi:hypothetical protein BIFGAL_03842 [Bifidobacterium gallicum DSM 20093 = LMG 11596]|uniref:Uncharacterized protein n=1 Tax=Bifidobacterium gallicum DSM 20093 = LMG 11596 TaxID=561180 RepID=D1NVF6_9BIFI|nr:hypothetical protein BIFGAL_03842 [Bifidobacterium gallicum DSM 20093 = LMG 11596]
MSAGILSRSRRGGRQGAIDAEGQQTDKGVQSTCRTCAPKRLWKLRTWSLLLFYNGDGQRVPASLPALAAPRQLRNRHATATQPPHCHSPSQPS